MAVDQHIAGVEILSQTGHGVVDGAVAVGMIFTHAVAHDTGRLTVRLVGGHAQFAHRVQDTALYRFEAVPYIRKGTGHDDAHRVIDIAFPHQFFQVDGLYPVMMLDFFDDLAVGGQIAAFTFILAVIFIIAFFSHALEPPYASILVAYLAWDSMN